MRWGQIRKGARRTRIDTRNYHPISLTSITCKMLERVIRDAITSQLKHQQHIDAAQLRFLSFRSCITTLLSAANIITKTIDVGLDLNLCSLNLNKVNSMENHRIIFAKQATLRVFGHLITWIRNFVTDRTSQVRIHNALSNEAMAPSGVP